MKNSFTEKGKTLKIENKALTFRKEEFGVRYHYYEHPITGDKYTTQELDEINLNQLYNQYRAKHHLPFPEEIIAIRNKYALPATKMSEILGFGINVYRNYESGEIPSESNARLIQLAKDPEEFLKLLKLSRTYEGGELEKRIKIIEEVKDLEKDFFDVDLEVYMMGDKLPDEYTGFKIPQLDKFVEMVVFFTERLEPYKTKMNKVLFYSDFLNFKKSCFSISGARYMAIQLGPVPKNFGTLFDYAANKDHIDIVYTEFSDGKIGEHFMPRNDRKFNAGLFSREELEVMEIIADKFKPMNTSKIVDVSHDESGWQKNVEGFKGISYKYGFELKSV
ncbi:MAG: DUF4065 domain-containing protein [Bacteroidia bacterium]|nr:DUF4065 domain-containing protein [Bacteroidia bacterium]